MIPQGLNLLYLPPFSIIGRFFATAILFGVLGSLFLLYESFLGNFYLFPSVHFFTIGFMAMTMVGALFQMLPVVAGAVIEKPMEKAFITHITLSIGALTLPIGIYLNSSPISLLGLFFLLFSIFYITPVMLKKLYEVKELRDAPAGFKFALFSFGIGAISGALLVLSLLGILPIDYSYLLELHLAFMLYGWTATLVASVSFQVIEMFFVTPAYPKILTKNLARFTFFLLLLKIFLSKVLLIDIFISILFTAYAVITIDRLRKRKRKLPDPLIYLWYISMGFLILASILYPLKFQVFYFFLTFFGVFVFSVIMSMMYRIIPFLVWMHLINQGVRNAPTMHQIIEPEDLWLNFYIYVGFIVSLVLLIAGESIIPSLLLLINFLLLLKNVYMAIFKYLKLRRA